MVSLPHKLSIHTFFLDFHYFVHFRLFFMYLCVMFKYFRRYLESHLTLRTKLSSMVLAALADQDEITLIHLWDFIALSYGFSAISFFVLTSECFKRIRLVHLIVLKARRSAFDGLNVLRFSCSWEKFAESQFSLQHPHDEKGQACMWLSFFPSTAMFKTAALTLMRSSDLTYPSVLTCSKLYRTLMMSPFQHRF